MERIGDYVGHGRSCRAGGLAVKPRLRDGGRMDGWIIADPRIAAAVLSGKKREWRVPATSPLTRLAPGARIGMREACIPGRLRDDGMEVSTAPATATHACFPDGLRRGQDGSSWHGPPPRDAEELWLAAVHMPAWACRAVLVLRSLHAEPLRAITRIGLAAEGWNGLLARRAFARHWNATHPITGWRWQDDPPVTVLTFST